VKRRAYIVPRKLIFYMFVYNDNTFLMVDVMLSVSNVLFGFTVAGRRKNYFGVVNKGGDECLVLVGICCRKGEP
jgi:hypothetical protein